MKLQILAPAQDELDAARDYYLAHASPRIAAAIVDEFERALRLLLEYPALAPTIPGYERQRALPLRRFPYWVIYHLTTDTIVVNAFAAQRRRPGYWAKPE
jgi:toxin ParE1/3/4